MVTKEKAKEKVKELVEDFLKISQEDLNEKSEFQIQAEFIDPLFEALGWDMKKDAERERKIFGKRADYIMSLGNQEVSIIEAKKTSITLSDDKEGEQTVSYAYHKKIKFAILTNFKQIRVYHALSHTTKVNKNLLKDDKGYLWVDCKDFIKEFDRLWLLSKESFEKKDIDKLLKNVDKKIIKLIDESILQDLLEIREILSKDLKNKRTYLSLEQIDEAVQILIDRLIFMRSVEDRGLEAKDFLLKIKNSVEEGFTEKNLWTLLKDQFKRFDKTYNSKLFSEGLLEKADVFFDGKSLSKTIEGLYYGTQDHGARYKFNIIPIDLLGSIYEQYLGVVLRGTEKRVKLDLKSGKRKRMGIYYTPTYIVDYIIKNTVGEYIKNKTIDEVLEVKIVDPACGSGSFLIRAFSEVCNTIKDKLKKGEKSERWESFKKLDSEKLSLGQKAAILLNCVYGVDLDEKAIELTQLNLLLKMLEEETRETKKRLLPNMKDNIKNGNSLINDPKIAGDKAFNWHAQFPEVFREGGFDVVIGNPPYFSVVTFNKKDAEFFRKRFSSSKGQYNIYNLFIEQGINLLKNKGLLGFITQNTFLIGTDYVAIRNFIINNSSIKEIIDLGGDVFKDANVTTCISILLKDKRQKNQIKVSRKVSGGFVLFNQEDFVKNKAYQFNIYVSRDEIKIIEKIEDKFDKIEDLFNIMRGIETISKEKILKNKNENSKKILLGKQNLKRYHIKNHKFIEYNPKHKKEYKNEEVLNSEKIIIPEGASQLMPIYDSEGFWITRSLYALTSKKINLKYVVGILNSKLYNFYTIKNIKGNVGYTKIRISHIKNIPIKIPDKKQEKKIVGLVNQMLELQKKFHDEKIIGKEKERLEQQIKNIDYDIDQEVYKLYGITEEEQRIIEENLIK